MTLQYEPLAQHEVIGTCWICGWFGEATTAKELEQLQLVDGLCRACHQQYSRMSESKKTVLDFKEAERMVAMYRLVYSAVKNALVDAADGEGSVDDRTG